MGLNLRRYRKERGLSQESFADYVGVHRTYMGSVERGERNLTLQSLERMADFLEIDPRELLTEVEEATGDGSTSIRESR
ncbi:helix-turn-helix domain-containing protein [Mycobacteroides abscessus]|uniref:helix-turn-helix domain-containing protein n=1 Tax=Mycobacteroides abscessus TaxID=36809 RepID=UPI0027E22BE4|nr:helix-turn-helix transcriptional regulator [Mycobacteroides abscessus]